MMKKWSLTLKVFLIVLAVSVLYVLIASIVRVAVGQVAVDMALTRFITGSLIGLLIAGIAAGITALVVAIKNKKKLSPTLIVFLTVLVVGVLYVLIATIVRVRIGQIETNMAVVRFVIGSIIAVVGAGVAAGITALVMAIKKLGQ